MNKYFQKVPFILELFVNGFFIFLYSFYSTNKMETNLISPDLIQAVLGILAYLAPAVILVMVVSNYVKSIGPEDFFRRYIFSLIVFIPLLITFGDIEFAFWLSAVHLFSSVLSLYEGKPVEKKEEHSQDIWNIPLLDRIKLAPAQIVIMSFSGLIVIGTLLLALPISAAEGKTITMVDAFFTATSATCVTGLSTLSLAENFSFVGQVIVLLLIQIGGLGYMTLYSSLTILLGRSLAVKEQVLMQDLLDISSFEDLLSMIIDIIKFTLVIELVGAIILTVAFTLEGYEFGQALYYGLFHSVSAFCNAGFALFDNSLENFGVNPMINGTISTLIILGGLGFIVIKELELIVFRRKKIINLSVHSKIVIVTNVFLVGLVAVYIFFSEYLHSLTPYSIWEQLQISFFQSITTRTAGFNTIGLNSMYPHTLYLMCLIMFIGASPGSTGGGIKTTTFAILFQSVKATLKGRIELNFLIEQFQISVVVRATAIIVISLIIVSFFILLMMRLETEHSFLSIFFEVVSAFATVGLSLGITPYLSAAGKLAIILLMFIGRVGPLTLALPLDKKEKLENKLNTLMEGFL
jgi:trk system potassium uptake protein TrkH